MPTLLETFEQLIRHRTAPELLPFLLALGKADIVPVRNRTASLKQELEKYVEHEVKPNTWESKCELTPQQNSLLFMAAMATYSRKEVLASTFDFHWQLNWGGPDSPATDESLTLKILEHRRPDWLAEWLTRRTRANPWSAPPYVVLRTLEARQLMPPEPWLTAQSVAHLLIRYNWQRSKGGDIEGFDQLILQDLQADPTLLTRDLPLLLDYDTMAPSASTWSGKERTPVTWLTLLSALLASGHLHRDEWLSNCLLALRRDFRRPLLTWIKTLYVSLQPTPAELLARQAELRELLSHALPLVVNFALDQLKEIWTLPGFELAALLPPAEALLSRQELKTGLRTLLTGLDLLLKADPAQAAPVARLYASTLTHADANVQTRAAKSLAALLAAKKPLLTPAETAEATAAIGTYAELLGPPARAALAPWLDARPAAPALAAPTERYEPLAHFRPELSATTAVVPVADWHELLFLTGQVLRHNDPLARERWLDGLLRLHASQPAGYAAQLQPYLNQIIAYGREPDAPLTLEEARQAITGSHPPVRNQAGQAQALVLGWIVGFVEPLLPLLTPSEYDEPDPLVVADQQRFAFAETLLRTGRPLPLLSTPTHGPHWVAPTVLVQRLLTYEAAGQCPHPTDLAVALCRLAWAAEADATAAATQLLPSLRHAGLRELLTWLLAPAAQAQAVPAVRLMTGADPDAAVGSEAAALAAALPWLWAVAARTRLPGGEFPALAALTPPNCANVVRPCPMTWDIVPMSRTQKITWKVGHPEETEHWLEFQVRLLEPVAAPPTPVALYALHPAALPATKYLWRSLNALVESYGYLAALLPQYPAPLHWRILELAAPRDSADAGLREILRQALHELLIAGPVLDEPASLLLAVGLTQQQPLVRALAFEALLATIEHGRLVPATLAAALGRLLSANYVPLPRLTAGLAQARAIAPRTDDALRQLLEALLPALPAAPLRQTSQLLTLYTDLPGRAAHPVPTPVQARLRDWSTSAPLKKLVVSLLA